jgi:hypothetical protein
LSQFQKERLAPDLFPLLVEDDSLHLSCARDGAEPQTADEQIVLPLWETIACIERHSGYGDRRHPSELRILETGARSLVRYFRTAVLPPGTTNETVFDAPGSRSTRVNPMSC